MTTECDNPVGYFGDYDRIHTIADRYSCSTECPCNVNKALWPTTTQSRIVTTNVTASAFNRVSNCTAYSTYITSESLDFDNTLSKIEDFFGCSGICTKSLFYALTDISR